MWVVGRCCCKACRAVESMEQSWSWLVRAGQLSSYSTLRQTSQTLRCSQSRWKPIQAPARKNRTRQKCTKISVNWHWWALRQCHLRASIWCLRPLSHNSVDTNFRITERVSSNCIQSLTHFVHCHWTLKVRNVTQRCNFQGGILGCSVYNYFSESCFYWSLFHFIP